MDLYVYIKSNESDPYFSDNLVHNLKVHFNVPLIFSGFWKVGLAEFTAKMSTPSLSNQSSAIYIYSNICKCSIVDGVEKPLLRRLEPNEKHGWNYIFENPIYLPLKTSELINLKSIY